MEYRIGGGMKERRESGEKEMGGNAKITRLTPL